MIFLLLNLVLCPEHHYFTSCPLTLSVVSPGQEVGEEGPDSDVEGEPGCHPGAMGTFSNVIISL